MIATELMRVFLFKYKGKELKLADPEPTFTPEAVQDFYTNTYPELVTSKIEGPSVQDDEVQYRFTSTIGTKG